MLPKTTDNQRPLTQAATRITYGHGFRIAALAEIAKAAKVPLGNVYYYFKTKGDPGSGYIHCPEFQQGSWTARSRFKVGTSGTSRLVFKQLSDEHSFHERERRRRSLVLLPVANLSLDSLALVGGEGKTSLGDLQ